MRAVEEASDYKIGDTITIPLMYPDIESISAIVTVGEVVDGKIKSYIIKTGSNE